MILYRGTPYREKRFRPEAYGCVFFASTFETAAEYAAGEKAVVEKWSGYVAKYDVGRQHLLDADDRKSMSEILGRPHHPEDEILFFEPTEDWIQAVTRRGYTGTKLGDEICIFDVENVTVIDIWRVELSESKRSWHKKRIR